MSLFDCFRLENELQAYVQYQSDKFAGKYAYDLTKFIENQNLQLGFRYIDKLSQSINTTPSNTSSFKNYFLL